MSLKMKELMVQTNESKSTILYYVKEGLLPEPSKPKPNVHLYDESCVKIIKFIKHLQHSFSYSIAEIKAVFSDNNFTFNNSFEMMIKSLELISGGKENTWYTQEDFLELAEISEDELYSYEKSGYIFERARGFSSKELDIVKILQSAKSLGLDFSLLDTYVDNAKVLAKQEFDTGAALLKNDENEHDRQYELLFDLILTLKPYIFNMHTVSEHKNRFKEA